MSESPESLDELIRDIAYNRIGSFDDPAWTPDELYAVLTRAAKLDTTVLAQIAMDVGIRFSQPETADKEDYLLVLEEADDIEKLKKLLQKNERPANPTA